MRKVYRGNHKIQVRGIFKAGFSVGKTGTDMSCADMVSPRSELCTAD
jgi:hypothetical protein